MWGRGALEIRPYRVGSTFSHRAFVAWRAASSIPGESTGLGGFVLMSPRDSLTGTWTSRDLFVDFENGLIAHAFNIEVEYDTRSTTGARGLRGIWGEFERCPAMCPSGTTCQSLSGGSSTRSACMTPYGFFRARERRAPGADGVVPMIAEDFNEWRMLRHAYCATLRDEAVAFAPGAYAEDRSSCAPVPDYGL